MALRITEPPHASRRRVGLGVVLAVLAAIGVFLLAPRSGGSTASVARGEDVSGAARTARSSPAGRHRGGARAAPSLAVSIAWNADRVAVPRSFLGLSTEYWTLPVYERHLGLLERVMSMVRIAGDGPLVLRVGGDSADHALWDPRLRHVPRWAFGLTPRWLSRTATLVRALGLRVILDLNLLTASPLQTGAWARAAEAGLPRGSIVGFEIGNEDDIYDRVYWLAFAGSGGLTARTLPATFSAARYVHDFRTYARVLAAVAPRVPLIGPVVSEPMVNVGWFSDLLAQARSRLGAVSAHRYPYAVCLPPDAPGYPTIPRILSDDAAAGVARSVRRAVWIAHRAGLPFRLTELNSVTCGGRAGVSDAFATALWAPDAIFHLLRAGVDGVNIHTRAFAINAPFALDSRGLIARPLLYGLILAARTLGPDGELLRVRERGGDAADVKAWAVRVRGGAVHLLLIDKGRRSVTVALRLPAGGIATVTRLLAPSVRSRFGMTLAGQRIGRDGRWKGRPAAQRIATAGGRYEIVLPRYSAALVTIPRR